MLLIVIVNIRIKATGDNYGVTIYKNSRATTATLFSNKVSVEILDRVFFRWLLQTNKQSLHL